MLEKQYIFNSYCNFVICFITIHSMEPKQIPHVIKRGVEEKTVYTHALNPSQ